MGEDEGHDPEFDLVVEVTGLEMEQVEALKKGFDGFDKDGGGTISQTTMQMILKSMGVKVDKDDLENYAGEIDESGAGKFTFAQFCQIAARFMIEDDEEQMKEVLKEILREIDSTLTESDLENIIEEVDEDASGTLDFDEFQEMMMG